MTIVAAIALAAVLAPVYFCAHHPWMALLAAAVLGLCVRFERAGVGRWRWLAAAGCAWVAFGLRELFFPDPSADWGDTLRLDLVGAAVILWILTGIALLRAGSALSPPWPIAMRVIAVALIVASVIGPGLVAWIHVREALYPWTDWSAPHAVLHVSNESATPIFVTWRWEDDVPHRMWRNADGRVAAHGAGLEMVGPILPPGGDGWPLPADAGRPIVVIVQVPADIGPFVEHPCLARLGGHVRVRVSAEGEGFVASGSQSFLGAPQFGDEVALPER